MEEQWEESWSRYNMSLPDFGAGHFNNTTLWQDQTLPQPTWPPSVSKLHRVTVWMDHFFVPAVIAVGLVGNSLSFIVFIFSHLRRLSSSVYLAALAVSDTGFLVCVLVSWMNNLGVDLFNREGWCQAFVYMTYVWSFLSVWYVVAFTVERYIAVCLPFRRHHLCTASKARLVVSLGASFALLLYNFATWTSKVQTFFTHRLCWTLPQYHHLVEAFNSVDTVVTFIIPSITIVVLNVRIICAVVQIHRQRHTLNIQVSAFPGPQRSPYLRAQASPGAAQHVHHLNHHHHHQVPARRLGSAPPSGNSISSNLSDSHTPHPSQVKVTKTLVLVSSIFLLLNFPTHATRLYAMLIPHLSDSYEPHRLALTQRLLNHIYYLNFAVNFFLYNTCGRNFRLALAHVARKIRYKVCRWRCAQEPCLEERVVAAVMEHRNHKSSSSSRSKSPMNNLEVRLHIPNEDQDGLDEIRVPIKEFEV